MKFSPGIYEHAAALIGRTPWEVSRSRELLVAAHHAAWQRYHLQLQEEAARCLQLATMRPNCSVGCGVVPFECDPAVLLQVKAMVESPPRNAGTDC